MLVVHAGFVPAAEGEQSELFLWGEGAEEAAWRPGLSGGPPLHPFGASPATLRDALAELGLDGALTPATAIVLLPSGPIHAVAAPQVVSRPGRVGAEARVAERVGPRGAGDEGSPVGENARPNGGHGGTDRQDDEPAVQRSAWPVLSATAARAGEVRPWRVGGLRVMLAAATPWLVGLDAREDGRSSATTTSAAGAGQDGRLGADLRYWARAAALALELLRDGQVVPTLARRPDGDLQAVWRPALSGQAERRRARALVEAMPPACRSFGAADEPAVPSAELLNAFLGAATDALARGWLAEAVWPEARWLVRDSSTMPAAVARWLEALAGPRAPAARLSARRAGDLARELAEWTGSLLAAGPSFRLCLRLRPPTAPSDRWRLDYLLQAGDDPSVLVPAETVWAADAAVVRLAGRLVPEPQELLLADLGRAAKLVPAVAASLVAPRPRGADLTVEEAHAFLREGVPALAEAGFGVLAPPWWTRRGARRRIGVRLRMAAAADAPSSGVFGLQSLVEYDWQLALGDEELTPEEFERLVRLKAPLVELRGEWVELDPDQLEAALRYWQSHGGGLSLAEAARLAAGIEDTGLPISDLKTDGWLAEALAADRQLGELAEPPGFVGQLRPYQRRGFAWLSFMRDHGLGACLADDMGLGKTPTTIAFLLQERQAGPKPPTLVVCPASVLGNWVRELARFGPGLRVLVHHGPARAGDDAFAEEAGRHDVVLTTYALVHRDEARLAAVPWTGIVLDEAQNVKNATAAASRAARRVARGYRVALTGTPVENRLGELWSIMELLNPGFLGSAEGFRRRFARPIEREGNAERAEELRRLVGPFVLRRLKSDPTVIRDLPEKIELKDYPPLTREQASLYEAIVQEMLAKIGDSEGVQRRGLILAALTKLKQVCNHPAHYLADGSALPGRSGKLMRLEELLDEAISEGDRTLVFTQFAEWGGRLRAHLAERLGKEVLYLYGGTPVPERDRIVQRFQADDGPPVFVLSLRAGGVGLNLTRANRVVHFDRWWNPAVEAQATDRAFRIGQTRNVHVHAFVCAGTLEERIDQLIESKRALAEAVIGTGESWLTELTTEDLRSVVQLRQAVIVDG